MELPGIHGISPLAGKRIENFFDRGASVGSPNVAGAKPGVSHANGTPAQGIKMCPTTSVKRWGNKWLLRVFWRIAHPWYLWSEHMREVFNVDRWHRSQMWISSPLNQATQTLNCTLKRKA